MNNSRLNLLLISNSTMGSGKYAGMYLEHCLPELQSFIVIHHIESALFIPYAGVTVSWDDYEEKVAKVFKKLRVELKSIHHEDTFRKKEKAIHEADCIIVGGGNTFNLVKEMHDTAIMEVIAKVVKKGKPFMGWSAGANVACPTLKTTNDMPIVEPPSFKCLNLIPFQINPHYLDTNPEGHGGETREMRIEEFIVANPEITVVGLREGCMFEFYDGEIKYIGDKPARIFNSELNAYDRSPDHSFYPLLK